MKNIPVEVEKIINEIKNLDVRFKWTHSGVRQSGNDSWVRFWCESPYNGCQIGKLNVKIANGLAKIYNYGSYKPVTYEFDPADDSIWVRIGYWISNREYLTDEDIKTAETKALIKINKEYSKRVQWRKDNPPVIKYYVDRSGRRRRTTNRKGLHRRTLKLYAIMEEICCRESAEVEK